IDHGVNGVLQLENLSTYVHGDLLGKVAVGNCGGHLGDVPHLAGEVVRHGVDAVGGLVAGSGYTLDLRLPAELSFRSHLAGHAGPLGREPIELIDHGVDGVLQLEDFSTDVHGNLLRKVAVCHGGGHLRDVSHLSGEVVRHGV